VTRQPNFSDVWIKVERAKEHVSNLEALVERFLHPERQPEPYRVLRFCELDTGDLVFKVKASGQPPLSWSAILGDAIHNLRSSLDLLVCELVRAEGNKVGEGTKFPMFRSAASFANAFNPGPPGAIKGAPQRAIDLIKAAQPYKGANNAFWRLHQLDIVDKHKLLVPVGMAQGAIIHDLTRMVANNPDLASGLTTAQPLTTPADISTTERQFPLEDGTVIYRVPARGREDVMTQMHMHPELTFEVAFGEGEVVKGEPLVQMLHELVQFVEGYIKRFPPLFSSQTGTP